MAESNDKAARARLDRLEGAIVQITDVLVLQGERMDFGFKGLRDEMHALRGETRAMHESLADRLDRLIAITMKERTTSNALSTCLTNSCRTECGG